MCTSAYITLVQGSLFCQLKIVEKFRGVKGIPVTRRSGCRTLKNKWDFNVERAQSCWWEIISNSSEVRHFKTWLFKYSINVEWVMVLNKMVLFLQNPIDTFFPNALYFCQFNLTKHHVITYFCLKILRVQPRFLNLISAVFTGFFKSDFSIFVALFQSSWFFLLLLPRYLV